MRRAVFQWIVVATIETEQVPTRRRLADCDHRDLAYIGAGGSVSYYRCRVCGKAVIEERSRRWVIRATGEEAR